MMNVFVSGIWGLIVALVGCLIPVGLMLWKTENEAEIVKAGYDSVDEVMCHAYKVNFFSDVFLTVQKIITHLLCAGIWMALLKITDGYFARFAAGCCLWMAISESIVLIFKCLLGIFKVNQMEKEIKKSEH